jgi:hypothetical protein
MSLDSCGECAERRAKVLGRVDERQAVVRLDAELLRERRA